MHIIIFLTALFALASTVCFGEGAGIPAGARVREVPRHPDNDIQPSALVYFVGEEKVGERRYYNNDKILYEIPMKNGLKQGIEKNWHSNGQLASEIPYDKNLMNGECRYFSQAGILLGSNKMDHGTGVLKEWYDDGQLKSECEMKDGKRDGEYKVWYKGDKRAVVEFFVEGQEEGDAKAWYPDGKPLQTALYRKGHMIGELVMWDENGKQTKEYCVNDKKLTREQYIDLMKADPSLPKPMEDGK